VVNNPISEGRNDFLAAIRVLLILTQKHSVAEAFLKNGVPVILLHSVSLKTDLEGAWPMLPYKPTSPASTTSRCSDLNILKLSRLSKGKGYHWLPLLQRLVRCAIELKPPKNKVFIAKLNPPDFAKSNPRTLGRKSIDQNQPRSIDQNQPRSINQNQPSLFDHTLISRHHPQHRNSTDAEGKHRTTESS